MIEIYSKDNCPNCDTAVKLAEKHGLHFSVKKLDQDFNREQLLEKFPDARSFPIIVANGTRIGGLKEFSVFVIAHLS
jgi:glutaredoxin 3